MSTEQTNNTHKNIPKLPQVKDAARKMVEKQTKFLYDMKEEGETFL